MRETLYRPATLLVHQGTDRDPYTGAATVPIYQASTYHHPGGTSGDYDYARSGNPSRAQIEQAIALLEGGCSGFAYSSGMAAIAGSLSLLKSGDHLIAPRDLYGGTWRYLNRILPDLGISVTFVDTGDLDAIHKAIQPETKGLFLETPSNPLFNITDIRSAAALAKEHKLISFLDNTFMTPLLQKPIVLGIDVVIHSATKFLGGHSDLLAGLVTTKDNGLAQSLKRHQNAYGSVLAPFDAFLLSRGLKTLKLRLETGQSHARTIAERLRSHPAIERVIYPGLDHFPGAERHFAQASGAGAVLSFEVSETDHVQSLLKNVNLPIIAPSLGGVETILTHCWTMSHAAIPEPVKTELGITPKLLRISAGIEDVEDLWEDLDKALSG